MQLTMPSIRRHFISNANVHNYALGPVIAFIMCRGSVKIQGDMGLMMQFQNWFAR